MKKALLVFAVLFVSLLISAKRYPKIVFESNEFNLDTLYVRDSIKIMNIKYWNTSKKPFIIKKVDASCECTEILSVDSLLQKGQTGNLEVKLNIKDLEEGLLFRTITFDSNIKDRYSTISIYAYIKK